ncbi:serine/threonine-protein kinase [Pyxidicoccus sp. MSG2]|uniref:serine/threonine-protein kinase n=1 Tax=Pyxidicoccus sp. MSG2 TaxID=2996790 RepID=UPI00226F04AD|nr:serine/threonine protein kinase [Pyxidicoccus sp. MSG2]MCY1023767.1 protein kinase [Pyxidicoccus sp. MSG2]
MPLHAENFQVYPEALGPGTEVGTWRVVERLGVGGFGAVYRVEDMARPGEFYALKLALRPGDERAEREVALLMIKAVHRNVVRLHACGRWPHPQTGYLYFVMDWVNGRPLDTWAEEVNPSFRELAQSAGKVALAFDALHRAGVLHRDLKPAHILIREPDGEPLLIDFGIGDYAGAATITEQTVPPGTLLLRSPESVRFHRANHGRPGARYEYQPTDDLYALGVSLYRAVTGHYPFPPHLPPDMLYLAIEGQTPPAPADFNRRTPRALSGVIMRLLAKKPQDRYPTGTELHAALMAAVSFGKSAAWEASLFEWDEEQGTELDPSTAHRRRIRRPEWPTYSGTPPAPRLVIAPALPFVRQPDRRDVVDLGQEPPVEVPPVQQRLHSPVLVVAVLLAGMVGLAAWGMRLLEGGAASDAKVPSSPSNVVTRSAPLREVAPVEALPEAAPATAPLMVEATAVAAAPLAALTKEDAPVMKESKPSASALKKVGMKAMGVAGACLNLACSGPQVRPTPPPEECPPGALEAMKELGIELGDTRVFVFDVIKGEPHVITVREGNTTVRLGQGWEGLRSGSLLYGKLYLSERVYGRFTWARTNQGRTYPVCIELLSSSRERGLERKPGSEADFARIWTTGRANPVNRFE